MQLDVHLVEEVCVTDGVVHAPGGQTVQELGPGAQRAHDAEHGHINIILVQLIGKVVFTIMHF